MTILPFKPSPKMTPPVPDVSADATLKYLIRAARETNIIALTKTLNTIAAPGFSLRWKSTYLATIGERICRAAHEVRITLPEELR